MNIELYSLLTALHLLLHMYIYTYTYIYTYFLKAKCIYFCKISVLIKSVQNHAESTQTEIFHHCENSINIA